LSLPEELQKLSMFCSNGNNIISMLKVQGGHIGTWTDQIKDGIQSVHLKVSKKDSFIAIFIVSHMAWGPQK
jgi:hypothetical protein